MLSGYTAQMRHDWLNISVIWLARFFNQSISWKLTWLLPSCSKKNYFNQKIFLRFNFLVLILNSIFQLEEIKSKDRAIGSLEKKLNQQDAKIRQQEEKVIIFTISISFLLKNKNKTNRNKRILF